MPLLYTSSILNCIPHFIKGGEFCVLCPVLCPVSCVASHFQEQHFILSPVKHTISRLLYWMLNLMFILRNIHMIFDTLYLFPLPCTCDLYMCLLNDCDWNTQSCSSTSTRMVQLTDGMVTISDRREKLSSTEKTAFLKWKPED